MNRKTELLSDINKMIEAIDAEVDSYIMSRNHSNPLKRKMLNQVFEAKKENTQQIASDMVKKYER